jgi:hypothetical protein
MPPIQRGAYIMACYRLEGGRLQECADPIGDGQSGDYYAELSAKGYQRQLSSVSSDAPHSEVTLFETDRPSLPRFYIDITGRVSQLAVLVADDFPGLVQTLKEVQPLIALMRLEQQAEMHVHSTEQRDVQISYLGSP